MKQHLRGICVLAMMIFCLHVHAAASDARASISVVGPDKFRALPNSVLDQRFAVRVVDAQGAPMPGLVVDFMVNGCIPSPMRPDSCPVQTRYPDYYGTFGTDGPNPAEPTDANGVAVAPQFTVGALVGSYDVAAAIYPHLHPENGVVGSVPLVAFLHIDQVGLMTTTPITASFTGAWYDPNQSGHGIFLEILPDNRVVAYWFAHDPEGNQAWFGGSGTIANDVATVDVDQGMGRGWVPNFDSGAFFLMPWGIFTFSFSDCNHGRIDFASSLPSWGANHMDLTRLTLPAGLTCP